MNEGCLWKQSVSLSLWQLCKGKLEEGFFTGDPEGYLKEGSGNGQLSHRSPVAEPGGGFAYQGLRETVKERSVTGAYLFVAAV